MANPLFGTAVTNPFGLTTVGLSTAPTFVDIDGDGDLDAFVGEASGSTLFFRNTGNTTAPGFSPAETNPFGLTAASLYGNPTFADIDGDGDLDAFIGEKLGNTLFFRNTGSTSAPGFSPANPNPFGLPDVGFYANPTFADIDGDGDLDAFVGERYGSTLFFRNTGSTTAPAFSPANPNPFGLTDVGLSAAPTFADIDADGDLDAFVGNNAGNTLFFRNTGSTTAPGFSAAETNPFGLNKVFLVAVPTLVDIDNDGDLDAFVGDYTGNTLFFTNHSISNWSLVTNGQVIPFVAEESLLRFDDSSIAATAVEVTSGTGTTSFTYGGKTITLQTDLTSLTTSNITFADGSQLIVGDNNAATTNDDSANTLTGGSGKDQLLGLGGDDLLDGGVGSDALIGGAGNDTYMVGSSGDVVTESTSAANEIDLVQSHVTYTLGANLENLELAGSDAINGFGNSANNILTGNIGANLLDGSTGSDTLIGGSGADTYVVQSSGDVVNDVGDDPSEIDLVRSTVSFTLSANLENLKFVDSVSIQAVGNSSNNNLNANAANNLLDGLAGTDTLIGGNGDDTYVVDDSADVVTEFPGAGTDLVRSSVGFTLGQNLENLKLLDTSSVQAVGNALNNVLNANLANNVINGMAGADTMIGGNGDDTYVVDNTGDVVTEYTNGGTDSILSSVTYTLGANVNHLTLTGSAAINGGGNGGANVLTGNRANNNLSGDYGADSLAGCSGGPNDVGVGSIDTLTGGFDADHFILGNASRAFYNDGVAGAGSADYAILTDFQPSQGDTLGLKGSASLYTLGAYSNNSQNLYLDNGPTVGSFDSGDELIAKITTRTPVNLQQAIYQ